MWYDWIISQVLKIPTMKKKGGEGYILLKCQCYKRQKTYIFIEEDGHNKR